MAKAAKPFEPNPKTASPKPGKDMGGKKGKKC